MADKRAFATFDVGYFENPKMMDVLDASSIAVCMHAASVLYSSQHLTDGVISLRAIERKIGGSNVDSQILIDAGLWHLPEHECKSCPAVPPGKAYVHDYLEHNRSSEGAKGTSDKARDAANARWNKEREAKRRSTPSNAPSMPDAMPEPMPDAMHRQTDRQKLKALSSEPDEFDQWYSAYPRKEAKEAARKAFVKARKRTSFDELVSGLSRYSQAVRTKDREFIALPATWLNAGRWEDEAPTNTSSPWNEEYHQ